MKSKSLDLTGQSLWKYPLAFDTIDESDINQIYNLGRNQRLVPNLELNALLYPWD